MTDHAEQPYQETMALFIDGSNLYAAARALGFDIDYKRLLDLFASKGLTLAEQTVKSLFLFEYPFRVLVIPI